VTPTLRTLIVDDEELARLRLRSLLQAVDDPPVQVIGEAADAQTALAVLQVDGGCDLVLLDIRMPGRDGLQLAAALRSLPQPPSVVFVTAHGSHALRAFDLDAVDYLTKPVLRERLQAALKRVVQRRWPVESQPAPLAEEPVLVVNDRGRMRRIPVAEVLVLKAELKYVTLRTAQGSHLLDDSLTELERAPGPRLHPHPPQRAGGRARRARAAPARRRRRRGRLGRARGADRRMAAGVAPAAGGGARGAGRRLRLQPVLKRSPRSPAAMPLIDRWMPRLRRSTAGSPSWRWR
jgi:two-component system response regulator AlgR